MPHCKVKTPCNAALICLPEEKCCNRFDFQLRSITFAENAVLLANLAVIGVFDLDQKQTFGVKICDNSNLPLARCGAKARLQRVFQQIGEHQAHVDFIQRKRFRQIELRVEGDVLPLCKRAVIADDAVRRAVFTETHIEIRDAGDGFRKIGFQALQIAGLGQR